MFRGVAPRAPTVLLLLCTHVLVVLQQAILTQLIVPLPPPPPLPLQVVEIIGCKISRTITGNGAIAVVSSAPHTIGGVPRGPGSAEQEKNGNPIAFLGRVPVRIVGPVQDNELLVPSGLNDGTARAVNANDDLTTMAVIGQACINETHDAASSPGVGFVEALITPPAGKRASSCTRVASTASSGKDEDDWQVVSRYRSSDSSEEKIQTHDTGVNAVSELMNEINKMREEMNKMQEESKTREEKMQEEIRFQQRVNTTNITLGGDYVRCKTARHAYCIVVRGRCGVLVEGANSV